MAPQQLRVPRLCFQPVLSACAFSLCFVCSASFDFPRLVISQPCAAQLCEVGDDAEDEWDGVAPPCIVRASNGEVIEYAQLIGAVIGKLDAYCEVERVQAVGCSLISRLANCDAAKQQSVDAGALEAIASALNTHHASKHVAQCGALAVLKLTLPGQQRPDSRDAFRVQRAIDAGCLAGFARVLERYHARPVAPNVLPPLRVRLCAAANAWLEYVEENYLAPTAARYEGAYAHIRHAPLADPPMRPPNAVWALAAHANRWKVGTAPPPQVDSSAPNWWDEWVKCLW